MKVFLILFGIYLLLKNGESSHRSRVITCRDPEPDEDIPPQPFDD